MAKRSSPTTSKRVGANNKQTERPSIVHSSKYLSEPEALRNLRNLISVGVNIIIVNPLLNRGSEILFGADFRNGLKAEVDN